MSQKQKIAAMLGQNDVEDHRKPIPSSLKELRHYLLACCMRPQPGCSLSWTQQKGPKPFIQNIIYQNIALSGFQYAILPLAQQKLHRRAKRGRGHALDSSKHAIVLEIATKESLQGQMTA